MMNSPFFHVYENALPTEFCQEVVDRFDNDDRKTDGRIGDGTKEGAIDSKFKVTKEIMLSQCHKGWEDVMATIAENLSFHIHDYMKKWGRALQVSLYPEEYRICKYDIGGHFNWHSDNIGSSVSRVLTVIWYLNNVNKGGETEYPWQGIRIAPKMGSLLICPVGWTYYHRSSPVISNPKYILITQLHQKLNEV
jgi:hypothetical protein